MLRAREVELVLIAVNEFVVTYNKYNTQCEVIGNAYEEECWSTKEGRA